MSDVDMTDAVTTPRCTKGVRVDCPGCGVSIALETLRYAHICGRRPGRPRLPAMTPEQQQARELELAKAAFVRRMGAYQLTLDQQLETARAALRAP